MNGGGINTPVSSEESYFSFAPSPTSPTSPVLPTGPDDELDSSLLASLVSSATI